MEQTSSQSVVTGAGAYAPIALAGLLVGIVLALLVPLVGSLAAVIILGVVGGKYLTTRGAVTLGAGAVIGAALPLVWLFGPLFGVIGVVVLVAMLTLLYALACLLLLIVTKRS